jgi:hypothetical protein
MRRRVARSRPLRAFAVGVAIAVVLPWAATAGVEDYGSSQVMTFGDPALSATDESDAAPAVGGASSAIFRSEGALEAGDCTYAAGTVSLQVTVQRTLYVAHGEINSDEGPCGEATVANTDEVVVTGGSDDDTLVLDLE